MTFSEFLTAMDGTSLLSMIRKSSPDSPLSPPLHQKALEKFRTFILLGGMPEVLEHYRKNRDIRACQGILDDLLTSLEADFAKYRKRSPVAKLREVFYSIAHQTGSKFIFTKISPDKSIQGYKEALDLLIKAGLVYQVFHSSAEGIPLGGQMNPKKFKVLLFDIGLLQRVFGLDLSEYLIREDWQVINKGSLAEVFVGLEMLAHAFTRTHPQLFYWHRESRSSNAELDYLIQKKEEILPVEVKAGTKGQMQSMHLFLREKNRKKGIRISHENFGELNGIQIIPIYAVENLIESSLD